MKVVAKLLYDGKCSKKKDEDSTLQIKAIKIKAKNRDWEDLTIDPKGNIIDRISDMISGLFGTDKDEVKKVIERGDDDDFTPITSSGPSKRGFFQTVGNRLLFLMAVS